MFRRKWSGLPKDAEFPSNLKDLGYFVNEDDEIRSVQDPDNYFHFHINRNPRVNARQRFAFEAALSEIVHQRIQDQGLVKAHVPLHSKAGEPRVPILVSPGLLEKMEGQKKAHSRIVVLFGEHLKSLGILAGRVANGPGGVAKGTMVSVVKELHRQVASSQDDAPPGIVIANTGELYWWPEGRRSLTTLDSAATPLPSLVHYGRRYTELENNVPGNESPEKHVAYMFEHVLGPAVGKNTKLSLVGIGQSCDLLIRFFERMDNWNRWNSNLDTMLFLGTVYSAEDVANAPLKEFLAKRCRAYIRSSEPLDTPLAPPSGNPAEGIPAMGFPCYSAGHQFYEEVVLIAALKPALAFLQHVALNPDYENDAIVIREKPEPREGELENDEWDQVPEGDKPSISCVDAAAMEEQMRALKRLREIAKTGDEPSTVISSDDW